MKTITNINRKKRGFGFLALSLLLPLIGGGYWLIIWLFLFCCYVLESLMIKTNQQKIIPRIFLSCSGLVLAVFILIRVFMIDYYLIPSQSMSPTLSPGDKILVSKMAYGPRLPISALEVPMVSLLYKLLVKKDKHPHPHIDISDYKRGPGLKNVIAHQDIIVFNNPQTQEVNVKRCMGLPGDTIPPTDQLLSHFGTLIIPGDGINIKLNTMSFPFYQKLIEDFEQKTIFLRNGHFFLDGTPVEEYTFTQDYYFMLGDNQEQSKDSRHWGLVPHPFIIGKTIGVVPWGKLI